MAVILSRDLLKDVGMLKLTRDNVGQTFSHVFGFLSKNDFLAFEMPN